MNYISVEILKKYNCCEEQVELFKELFPTGIVKFNSLREAKLLAKKYSDKFDFEYLGCDVFGDSYRKAIKPHYDTCKESEKVIYYAHLEARKPHWDAYQEAKKPHRDKAIEPYREVVQPLWDAYMEVVQPLLAAYQEDIKPPLYTLELSQSQVFAKLWWELDENNFSN